MQVGSPALSYLLPVCLAAVSHSLKEGSHSNLPLPDSSTAIEALGGGHGRVDPGDWRKHQAFKATRRLSHADVISRISWRTTRKQFVASVTIPPFVPVNIAGVSAGCQVMGCSGSCLK